MGMLILAAPFLWHQLTHSKIDYDNSEKIAQYKAYLNEVDSLKQMQYLAKTDEKKSNSFPSEENNYKYSTEKNTSIQLSKFDPNTISKKEFEALGFKPFVIENILKYRSKGGKYKSKEQFKKVYGLTDEKFAAIEPYINITTPSKKHKPTFEKPTDSNKVVKKEPEIILVKFNPNNTSDEVWKQLGVNDFAIKNIKKYIEKGGTYKSKEQFKKVYGLTDNDFLRLEPYIEIPKIVNAKPFIKNEDFKQENEIAIEEQPTFTLFEFDPNSATADDWQKLGITDKTIKTINNYLSTGVKFYTKEDLKKVYNLTAEDYLRLEPYITIQKQIETKKIETTTAAKQEKSPNQKIEIENIIVDINLASAKEFQKLKGIGPTFSERIVKYREDLGGFISINQIAEVYGISDSLFQALQTRIVLNTTPVKQININKASIETLSKHPYISDKLADHIVTFRYGRNGFKKVKDLKRAYMVTDKIYKKIEPYLMVEKKKSSKELNR